MKSSEISGLEKYRTRNFCIGLIASLSFALGAMNYTTYEKPNYDLFEEPEIIDDSVPIRRTPPEKKKVLPPPPKMTAAEKIDIEEEIEFIEEEKPKLEETLLDEKIVEKEEVEYTPKPTPKSQPKPTPPVLPPPVVEDEKEYLMVEYMPRFPGCEDHGLMKEEKYKCAEKSMLQFIYSNIKYPHIARENGIEGTVAIQFVVGKDGAITDLKIAKDIGGGCGAEAARVLKMMPTWIPGIQQGNKVKVRYTIPVKYQLN